MERSASGIVIVSILFLLNGAHAGDACCKAEAARRGLVDDPFAVKPEFWDDEDDGPWKPPKVLLADLPSWYRWLQEVRLGLTGAAPWLLVGVIAAALLTTFLKPAFPSSSLHFWLGTKKDNARPKTSMALVDSMRGSLLGLVVPFCSCGALPLAIALKQEEISSSAIAAFVTAAQAAGVDSLFVTYGIFGMRVAFLRLAAAGVLAFLVGMTLSTTEKSKESTSKPSVGLKPQDSCCERTTDDCRDNVKSGNRPSLSLLLSTAVELFSSVSPWVVLGVMVSASASVWAPATSAVANEEDGVSAIQSFASRAILFSLSLPMTICEHGIVSLADALRGFGFSAGTAVSLVVVGPSTNFGTLLLLSRLNETSRDRRQWILDALKMTGVVVIFGVLLSYLADDVGRSIVTTQTMSEMSRSGGSALPSWWNDHAISIAGLFTIASLVQSTAWVYRSSSRTTQCSKY